VTPEVLEHGEVRMRGSPVLECFRRVSGSLHAEIPAAPPSREFPTTLHHISGGSAVRIPEGFRSIE